MTREQLFTAVQKSLEGHQIQFDASPEEGIFELPFHANTGIWLSRILCEANPALIHVFCRFGIKVAKDTTTRVSTLLHAVNDQIRMGAFYVDKAGFPTYRLALPIHPQADIDSQIDALIGTAMGTMDHHVRVLCLAAADAPEVRKHFDRLLAGVVSETEPSAPESRIEFN